MSIFHFPFSILHLLGLAAVSLLCGLLLWLQLVAAWPSIEDKIDQFRRQPPFVKLLLMLFVGIFVVFGSTKTNLVDQTSGTNIVEIVEDGTPGEIICRGECVMHEYWNNPEETAKMLRNGWLYTGDIGLIDEEGFLVICDRKKDLIITGGFNVFPSELEAVAITAPNVADAIAIGVPNERRGEVPALFVQPMPGKTVDLAEVEQVCREKLSRFKVPKEYYTMDMLPKTKNRKPDRKAVRKMYLEHAFDDQKK